MDYTTSDAYATDAGTGNRLHQQSAAVPTAVTDKDMNGVIWELMSLIKAANISPVAFDKTVPGSYTQVTQAVQALIAAATADYKLSCRVATTANIASLAGGAPNTLDGIALAANDRVLVKDQTTGSQNGIYVVTTLGTGANGVWTRAADADGAGELTAGAILMVEEGVLNADGLWELTTDGAVTIGTTSLVFTRKDASGIGGVVQGTFKNLQASATGANATVSVSADEIAIESSGNLYQTLRNVALAINSAATGANGLDTGVLAASTWYSIWVIYNGSAVAGLLSLSATAPTMPSGYTHKARVGWARTDGSGNKYPLSFTQTGRSVQCKVGGGNVASLPAMASGAAGSITTPTWVAVSVSSFVPPTAGKIKIALTAYNTTAMVAPNSSYGAYNSSTNPPPFSSSNYGIGNTNAPATGEIVLESTSLYWASLSASGLLQCMGWEDNL